ncbi:uncharacterized protein [Miscanthus floridulus]|uniref:uncharacterized protein isoform X1 n=1 Tax=Miscanthus floridulus TaxID=154761 RepID=UPI00345B2447
MESGDEMGGLARRRRTRAGGPCGVGELPSHCVVLLFLLAVGFGLIWSIQILSGPGRAFHSTWAQLLHPNSTWAWPSSPFNTGASRPDRPPQSDERERVTTNPDRAPPPPAEPAPLAAAPRRERSEERRKHDDDPPVLLRRPPPLRLRQPGPPHRNVQHVVLHDVPGALARLLPRRRQPWRPRHGLQDKAYFVDLFVRASNMPAIRMYEKLGYVVYRRVLRYYSGEEDGLDMRKALSQDVEKKSIIPLKRPITPDELEYD